MTYSCASGEREGLVSFVYIGTLSRIRRLDILLEAARMAAEAGAAFRLTLMGPGPDVEYFRGEVVRLDLADVVDIRPPVPYAGIPEAVAAFDVAVAFVPDVEDWNYQPTLKVLEYRALGMPILASDIPSNGEVVRDGENGILLRNTPAALAAGIARLAGDRGFIRLLRQNAGRTCAGLTWGEIADIHIREVYEPLSV